jgi:hypothetical protein
MSDLDNLKIFEDLFEVKDINPDGKKFDKGKMKKIKNSFKINLFK